MLPINIPNSLTILRILLIPVLVVVFYLPFKHHLLVAAGIFAVAAITDWFDGYLARRLGQMTAFGAFLDPVADKLMVVTALVLLVERHDTLLFTLAACVIIGREIVISALREWMAELGERTSVAQSRSCPSQSGADRGLTVRYRFAALGRHCVCSKLSDARRDVEDVHRPGLGSLAVGDPTCTVSADFRADFHSSDMDQ